MICRQDFRIKGINCNILSIRENGKIGFRLISLYENHSGCCMSFSNFPLKLLSEECAYVWYNQEFEVWI